MRALSFSKASFCFFSKQTPSSSIITAYSQHILPSLPSRHFSLMFPLRSQHPNLILGLGVAGSPVFLLSCLPNGFLPIFLALFSACLFSGSLFFKLINSSSIHSLSFSPEKLQQAPLKPFTDLCSASVSFIIFVAVFSKACVLVFR